MNSVGSSSTGNASSHSMANSRADPPRFPQTNEANGYGRIPDGFPPKDTYGVGNQQAAPLGLDSGPSYDSFLARQPAQTQSFDCYPETNPEVLQIYFDPYPMPGGLSPEMSWRQESDAAIMPPGTGTSSELQQTSMVSTVPPTTSHIDPPVAALPPIPSTSQVSTRHQLPNPSGAYGGPKGPMVVVPYPPTQ